MSKNHHAEAKHEDPKPVAAKHEEAPAKVWQWDGSNHHKHPEWLAEHNLVVHDGVLQMRAPQGLISATKGEHIVKDAKGNLHVSAHPSPASQPSSRLAPGTSA